jgi:threonine aldolase
MQKESDRLCREYGLYLFLDGARLPAALVAAGNDLAPADFANYCDVFYIGGTKNGLLFGEALVITNDSLKPHFRNMIKQRGGMFAKGFLFGTQFKAYFKDDLWLSMARHAVSQAQRIQAAAIEKGYSLYAVSPTNQVFLVLSHAQIERLKQDFAFELNGHVDKDHEAARFVCSWATRPEAVDALIAAL